MKDNTFIELAKMCFPNNSEIGKSDIVDMLCKIYGGRYTSEVKAERAAEDFLTFCSDRTELFVPASGEDRFKFFHRSFFEYFYSQYIFYRIREVDDVYNSLAQFDVDSEVFELTFAMMKQKDEFRYQELVEYVFSRMDLDTKTKQHKFNALNILTLGMQVIDDNVYRCRYVDYLVDNRDNIVKYYRFIHNQQIIYNVIVSKDKFINKIIKAYEYDVKFRIVMDFIDQTLQLDSVIDTKEYNNLSENERNRYFRHGFYRKFYRRYGNIFYLRIYDKYINYNDMLTNLTESDFENIIFTFNGPKYLVERYNKLLLKYKKLTAERRELIQNVLLNKQNKDAGESSSIDIVNE